MEDAKILASLQILMQKLSVLNSKDSSFKSPSKVPKKNGSRRPPLILFTKRRRCSVMSFQPSEERAALVFGVFEDLCSQYKNTQFVSSFEGKIMLHSTIIKDLWFNCYVSSRKFLKKLMKPLKMKIWIDSGCFYRSVLNCTAKQTSFRKTKDDCRERWLFFYCLIAGSRKKISRETLKDVFALSAKKEPSKGQILFIVNKCSTNSEIDSNSITFEEFKQNIIS